MKIRELIYEAPPPNPPANTTVKQPAAVNKAPVNPVGKAAFAAGQATAKGVQGAKNVAQAAGQAVATGAEKTANVVAKGAQATHDASTAAAGALNQTTSMLQKMRKGYANIDSGGKTAARSSDAGAAFDGINSNDLKLILSKVSQGQKLDPRETSLMKQAHDQL
jgi:hypothetical protein